MQLSRKPRSSNNHQSVSVREIYFALSAFRVIDRSAFPYFEILATLGTDIIWVYEIKEEQSRRSRQCCFCNWSFIFLFSVMNDHCHAGIKDKFQLSLLECQYKRYRKETNKGKTDSAFQLRRSGLRISGLRHFPGILNLTWMFQSYFIIHYMFSSYIISYYISKLFRYLLRIMYYEFSKKHYFSINKNYICIWCICRQYALF